MFCSQCGAQIPDNAKFCTKCGYAVFSGNASNMGNAGYTGSSANASRHKLTIVRQNQWFAINPDMEIIIDGMERHMLANGSSLELMVSPGRHNLAFHCTIRNRIVDINVYGDMTLTAKFNRITGSLEVR